MTTTIQPMRSGKPIVEIDGVAREFPTLWDALAEARKSGACEVLPFPNTPADVEVLAVAPALRVLP